MSIHRLRQRLPPDAISLVARGAYRLTVPRNEVDAWCLDDLALATEPVSSATPVLKHLLQVPSVDIGDSRTGQHGDQLLADLWWGQSRLLKRLGRERPEVLRDALLEELIAAYGNDSYDEALLSLSVRALAEAGQRRRALALLRSGRLAMVEIGLTLNEELVELERRLLEGEEISEIEPAEHPADARRDTHAFISYSRDDSPLVEQLRRELESRGVRTWTDRRNLDIGVRWREEIRNAIRSGGAFVAVFSTASEAREKSYMREELIIAIDELRQRPRDRAWFFPVLADECAVPGIPIGPGEDLTDLHWHPLYEDWDTAVRRLASQLKVVTASR